MEDSVDVILQDKMLHRTRERPIVMIASGAMLMASYGLWTVFALPGFRKVPTCLKVFAASSLGFRCTGFEINSVLIGYARAKARWMGIPTTAAKFVNADFWKTDLSQYKNLTVFLAPGVMEVLGRKLEQELAHDARVIACRFPFPRWHASASEGQGLDQAWAYDMATVHKHPA
ncbi:ATP synthase subunit C lysine N-methyltransferase isoform X2 [Neoarius graeffei]|uniref:ATP synthase subunit C lysine N-methyltransferase isoform X2 n=1 Tax=Neoarius graeffei TaxID=443677 RepID=UPI00298C96BB|nr:ATP synthase subunit C lysine N-methyltransferase isoform X2 [Neoarius graeffei]